MAQYTMVTLVLLDPSRQANYASRISEETSVQQMLENAVGGAGLFRATRLPIPNVQKEVK
jgi:hypothetical protein